MKPLPTPRLPGRPGGARSSGFTLIELILVMTMMVIVLSVVAPSLSHFFRGRTLDSEAKRFLALTRLGQSRAVSEGVPMIVWIDPKEGRYGLQADSSYMSQDDKLMQYDLNEDVKVQVEQSKTRKNAFSPVWRGNGGVSPSLPRIRFTPDGFITETSPRTVIFQGRDEGEILIGENASGLNYEIETNRFQSGLR